MKGFGGEVAVGAEMTDRSNRLRFWPYEVDLHTYELWKFGTRVKLVGQPFAILAMLVGRPGELVTREEMRNHLWPSDTFVDFNHGLNAAVNKLRETLSDSAENPRYIETLPRRGYRFIAKVESVEPWAAFEPASCVGKSFAERRRVLIRLFHTQRREKGRFAAAPIRISNEPIEIAAGGNCVYNGPKSTSMPDDSITISPGPQFRLAMVLAIVADALQLLIFPAFVEGALSPADDLLDVGIAAMMVRLLGWHWEFLPSFFAKLVPGVDLVPFWTMAVASVWRKAKTAATVQVHEPDNKFLPH